MIYDTIVIGHGPAGISCAINLKRASKAVLAIGKDLGHLTNDDIVANYYGFEEPISGVDLLKRGVNQAKNIGVELVSQSVINIIEENNIFEVKTTLQSYYAKSVLMATGIEKINLKIKNYKSFLSRGIVLCEVCDGFLYRNKKIGIYGKNPYLKNVVDYMSNLTDDITIFSEDDFITDYLVIKEPLLSFNGTNKLESVTTLTNTFDLDAIFIALKAPNTQLLAKKIGIVLDNKNYIEVDKTYQTNISGMFAAGDCIGGNKQVVKSSYDGYMASTYILKYLNTLKK